MTADIARAKTTIHDRTRQVVVNSAARNKGPSNCTNGEDFFLGLTHNGIEIYCTPVELLRFGRRDIVSLFRIPNAGHPLFDGQKEQFRSSLITLSRHFPEHLELVYRYNSRRELVAAIDSGYETTIPDQYHPLQVAFCDRYGNVRARAKRIGAVRQQIERHASAGGLIGLVPDGRPTTDAIAAHVVSCLDDIPPNAIGVYENVADGKPSDEEPGYIEIVQKFPEGGGEEQVEIDAFSTLGSTLGRALSIVNG